MHSSNSCLDKVVHTPVACNDRCPEVQSAENCEGKVVDVLAVQFVVLPQVQVCG